MGWGDEIRLEVPTSPGLLRLVRVTASGLASRLGWGVDAVEDVRLAVDEACWAVAGQTGPAARLLVRFEVLDGGAFAIEGSSELPPGSTLRPASGTGLSERILATLVDSYDLLPALDGRGPGFRMVTKQG